LGSLQTFDIYYPVVMDEEENMVKTALILLTERAVGAHIIHEGTDCSSG
jgi:hypothetical protein